MAFSTKEYKVATTTTLTLREWPDLQSAKLASIPPNSMVTASDQIKFDEDGYTWTYVKWGAYRGWIATNWLEGF